MITSDGYLIYQEINKNRLVICLPQTLATLTSTVGQLSDRRKSLSVEEEAAILAIVKEFYKDKTNEND